MRNKGIAYRKMLLSFSLVFVIPLCLVFAIYSYSYHVIEDRVDVSNKNLVSTIQTTCDRELQYYLNMLTQLSMNEYVETVSDQTTPSIELQLVSQDLLASIRAARTSVDLLGSACKDIFVYFPEIDRAFSCNAHGSMRLDTYIKEYYSEDPDQIQDMKAYLSTYTRIGLTGTRADKIKGENAWLTYCSLHSGNASRVTLGVWLDMNALTNRTASVEWRDGYDLLILDDDGVVVKGVPQQFSFGEEVDLEALYKDEEYIIYHAPSEVSRWTYVLLVPRELVKSSAEQIRTFFAISIFLCVLIACVLIRKATMLNYAPLEKLLGAFQIKNEAQAESKNEYQFLDDQIKNLISEKVNMESNISKSRKPLTQWSLTNLLLKPYDLSGRAKNQEWDNHIKRYSQGENLVMMARERVDGDSKYPQQFNSEMKLFIIENVFAERIGDLLHCSTVELEGRQILVLNDADIHGKLEQIQDRVFELQSTILDNFNFNVVVTVGAVHSGLEGIHKSYLEAREAEEFVPILDQDFISYVDIKDKTFRRYHYSLQAEERISAAVQNDNVQLAIALIHKVIDSSWADDHVSPHILKFLLHDIFCTLLKTADEKGCIDRIYMLPKDLGIENPVPEIKAHFSKVVESICDNSEVASETSAEKTLCMKVQQYIGEHYCDPNLNISQTALHFHMSPTALSATFKNETGKSLLMAINEVRIENAIKYLEQGCSVAETAEKVGVSESSSFIRLFKKYVGITPGQMKNQLLDKKE